MRFAPTATCLTAAVLAALAVGCQDNNGEPMKNTNSPSVRAPYSDRAKGDAAVADMSHGQYFPHGTKTDAILKMVVDGPKSVRVSQPASYKFTVTNVSDVVVNNVILSSNAPSSKTPGAMNMMADGKPGMALDDKTVGYPIGDLKPGESKSVTLTGTASAPGEVDTCYTALYTPPALCTMIQVTNPAVQLMVEAPATADICQPFVYKYTVKNTGTGTARNVVVKEQLPADLMTSEDGKQVVMAQVGDLAQGETKTVTASLKAAHKGKYDGQAIASANGVDSDPQSTSTQVTAPQLAVTVTGSDSDYVGQPLKYTISVTNNGDATSTNTQLVVQRSPTLGNVAVAGVDSTGKVSLGDIAPGQTVTKEATGTAGMQGGAGQLVATASSVCAGEAKGQTTTTLQTIPAILLETVDEHDPVKVGTNAIYDVKVTNQGSGPDKNVVVTATIPDGEEYVSTEGPSQPQVNGSTLTFPTIDSLPTKQSATWKVTVKAAKAGDVQFKTDAKCDGAAPASKAEPTKLY